MRIISKFKDYYDHVGHSYGLADPKVLYNRGPVGRYIAAKKIGSIVTPASFEDIPFSAIEGLAGKSVDYMALPNFTQDIENNQYWYYNPPFILCVAGRTFPVITLKENKQSVVFDIDKHEKFIIRNKTNKNYDFKYHFVQSDTVIYISKTIGHPVFMIKNTGWSNYTIIDAKVPILSDYGLANIYQPEQLYQDLEYFILNTMQGSPDIMPEGKPPQTNEEKITGHGFDLKQSFRHRK